MTNIYITSLNLGRGLHKKPICEDINLYYNESKELFKDGKELYSIKKPNYLSFNDLNINDKNNNNKITKKRLKYILKNYEVIKLHFSVSQSKSEYDALENNVMSTCNDLAKMFYFGLLVYQHHFKFDLKNCIVGDYNNMDDFFLENRNIKYEEEQEFLILELQKK